MQKNNGISINRHNTLQTIDILFPEVKGDDRLLGIDMEFKNGILTARLTGALNKDTVGLLKSDLEQTISTNGIKYVMLNLKRLRSIDSYGLKGINQCYKEVTKNKGKLIICGINKVFETSYELTDNLYQVAEEETAYKIVKI